MDLFPRIAKLALAATLFLALISLPAFRVDRNPGSALAPAVAWAGGSPDETLNPPPAPLDPKPTKRVASIGERIESARYVPPRHGSLAAAYGRLKGADRWEFLRRIYLVSMLRF